MFSPYMDGVTVEGVENGYVILGIRGSQSYREGEYTNERNATQTVRVEPDTADSISEKLAEAAEEAREHNA